MLDLMQCRQCEAVWREDDTPTTGASLAKLHGLPDDCEPAEYTACCPECKHTDIGEAILSVRCLCAHLLGAYPDQTFSARATAQLGVSTRVAVRIGWIGRAFESRTEMGDATLGPAFWRIIADIREHFAAVAQREKTSEEAVKPC